MNNMRDRLLKGGDNSVNGGGMRDKSAHKSNNNNNNNYDNLNNSISPANNTTSFISGNNDRTMNHGSGGFGDARLSNTARNLDNSYDARYAPAQVDGKLTHK